MLILDLIFYPKKSTLLLFFFPLQDIYNDASQSIFILWCCQTYLGFF